MNKRSIKLDTPVVDRGTFVFSDNVLVDKWSNALPKITVFVNKSLHTHTHIRTNAANIQQIPPPRHTCAHEREKCVVVWLSSSNLDGQFDFLGSRMDL